MRFDDAPPLPLYPIGRVLSPFREKMDAPRQGTLAAGVTSQIELFDDPRLAHALEGIEEWSHVWVLFWFDRDPHFSPKVQPPRSAERRGVLGTRSPHRPNPIGMSVARLLKRQDSMLWFDGLDLLNGTPVLDLKPYVPYADCITDAGAGWLERDATSGGWELHWSTLLNEQLSFLENRQVNLRQTLEQIFEAGPHAHPSRRIRREGSRGLLALKEYRLRFEVDGNRIGLLRLDSGYQNAQLLADDSGKLSEHLAFVAAFGQEDAATWLQQP